jgi:HEAT repeat protein
MGPGGPAQMLASKDPIQQQKAVTALAEGLDSPAGVQRIVQAVRHKDPQVVRAALRSVVVARTPDRPLPPSVLEAVEKAAEDPRPQVKITSIQVLEAVTPAAPEDTRVPQFVLKRFLGEASPAARAAAANALGKMLYWPATEALIAAMEDENVEVRGAAAAAVQTILGLRFNFRANDPPDKRAAVLATIKAQWKVQLPFHLDYARRLRAQRKANA